MRGLVLVMALLIASTAETEAAYHSIGAGGKSCGAWIADRHAFDTPGSATNAAFEEMPWVLGFLSGVGFALNVKGADPLDGMDAEGVFAWIDNYCQEHPIKEIADAAEDFAVAHPHR